MQAARFVEDLEPPEDDWLLPALQAVKMVVAAQAAADIGAEPAPEKLVAARIEAQVAVDIEAEVRNLVDLWVVGTEVVKAIQVAVEMFAVASQDTVADNLCVVEDLQPSPQPAFV